VWPPRGWHVPPSKRRFRTNRWGLPAPEPLQFHARCRNGHEYSGFDDDPGCPICGARHEVRVVCTHGSWSAETCELCPPLPPRSDEHTP
jgi:hypothetical protein